MSNRITVIYAALMAALGISVFAVPRASAASWAAIGVVAAGAIVVGTRCHSPMKRTSWWFLGGGLLAMAVGDALFQAGGGDRPDPLMAYSDTCYLVMFPLLTVGLVQLTRASLVLRDRSTLAYILTFTCAAVLLLWVLLIRVNPAAARLDDPAVSGRVAYAFGDLLILITLLRLLIASRRSTAVLLLVLGACGELIADTLFVIAQLGTGWRPGNPVELGYLVFYGCWGAAALRPSMVDLTAPVESPSGRLRTRWMVLLGLSLVIPPVILLVEALTGGVADGVVIAMASAMMSVFVVTRLADSVREQRRSVFREQSLRRACAALLSATRADQVSAAVRTAVKLLMPAGVRYRASVLAAGEFSGVVGGPGLWCIR